MFKKILKKIFEIPKAKLMIVFFFVAVILGEGLAMQILPIIRERVVSLMEKTESGEIFELQMLWPFFFLALLFSGGYVFFNRISDYLTALLNNKIWYHIFQLGTKKLLYHDLEYLSQERSSGYLNKIERAANHIANTFTEPIARFLRNFIKIIGALILITAIRWEITMFLILVSILYGVIYFIRFKLDIPYAKKLDELSDKEFSRIWEVIPQAKLPKIFGKERKEEQYLAKIAVKDYNNEKKRQCLWVYADIAQFVFVTIPTVSIEFYIAYLVFQGNLNIATFVLLFSLISSVNGQLWVVNWFLWAVPNMIKRSEKYFEIIESKRMVLDPKKTQKIKNAYSDIVFKNVSFSYSESKNLKKDKKKVLDDLNMIFKGGKVSALVGKSGSGKTTITNLICRFFDPKEGHVILDGINIKKYSQSDLRNHIGFVMQESFVFSGTIADNLRYAKENAKEEELIEACKKANAWEFINKFKKKLNTEIGERGLKLSGGQRQRISIARAILKNPSILILDEATNSLDSESEKLVQNALEKFMKNKTVIIVAHRLSTIIKADNIFLIENGKVKEKGNHKELIKKNGVYKKLYDIQTGDFEEKRKYISQFELE